NSVLFEGNSTAGDQGGMRALVRIETIELISQNDLIKQLRKLDARALFAIIQKTGAEIQTAKSFFDLLLPLGLIGELTEVDTDDQTAIGWNVSKWIFQSGAGIAAAICNGRPGEIGGGCCKDQDN